MAPLSLLLGSDLGQNIGEYRRSVCRYYTTISMRMAIPPIDMMVLASAIGSSVVGVRADQR